MTGEVVQFIGRERELAALSSAFEHAREGRGGIVLVSGEAGVGLTRLVEEAVARSGFHCLVGRAREDAAPSYAPVAGALRECMRSGGGVEDCGPLAEHLSLLLPELGAAPRDADANTLVEAIAGALAAQSKRRPTALLLEDLQWADNATLELLPLLDERLRGDRLVVIGTYRSDEIVRRHPVRRLRNTLRRTRRLREVTVPPLDREETAALIEGVAAAAPSAGLVDLVRSHTQGFPLYVVELTRALASGGALEPGRDGMVIAAGSDVPVPESIRDAVLIELDGLSEPARALAEVAAVAGTEFDFDRVGALAGEHGAVESGFDELLESGLLREMPHGRGAFRHALTREAVLAGIAWSRRRELHRRVAGALEAAGASPEAVAGHWLAAREHDAARRALLESAERSCRLNAYRDAAAAVARALEVWPDGDDETGRIAALERLAHCAQLSGQLSDSARALREVIASPILEQNLPRRAEALRALATVYQLQGAWDSAVETRRQSADAFLAAGLDGEAATEWLALAGRYTAALRFDAALESARRSQAHADTGRRWDTRARALGLEGNILAMTGDCEAGRRRVHEGLSLALENNLTEAASEVYRRLGSVAEFESDYTGARDAYATAIDYCRTRGLDAAEHTCLGCVSYIVLRTGEWKRALDVCREIASQDDDPGAVAVADSVSGIIRAHRGETRRARRLLQSALEMSRRSDVAVLELVNLYGLAVAADYEQDGASAERGYRLLMERWRRTQDRHDVIPWLCWAATFFAGRGAEEAVSECAEILASIASGSGNAEALAALAFVLGEAALLRSAHGDAVEQFETSLRHIEKLEVPLEHALTGWRLGTALERAGRRDDAVRRMTAAYRTARRLGARPLAGRIADALSDLGERVEEGRHPDASSRERRGGLTRRQAEIVALVATGLTNKEIAHRLYLSPRTVDMHVGNILDRLDCRSRTEAAQKARDLGIID